jgi:hypothetical protein
VGRKEERLEGEVREDEEGGMLRVDETWDIWCGSTGAGSRGSCVRGNGDGDVSW